MRLNLRNESKETVNYGVHHGARVLLLEVLSSQQALRVAHEPGTGGYLHSTAMGKAILSCLTEDEAWDLLEIDKLPRLTPHTLTTRDELFADVARSRERGWAVDNEESLSGLRCVAVPIEVPGVVLTALSVEAPISRMSDETLAHYGSRLLEVKESMQVALGASS
jgi:DNA-binding IclR family transcriptional regulator